MNERATATQSHNPRDDAAKAVPLPYKRQEEKVASEAPQGLHALADPMQKPSSCKHSVELSSAQKMEIDILLSKNEEKEMRKMRKTFSPLDYHLQKNNFMINDSFVPENHFFSPYLQFMCIE